jgi:predicted DCC family thiol-disulfide oxidoreductase YuxK
MDALTIADEGRHLLIYDGACGLCDSLVRFILPRDTRAIFHLASLQSNLGRSVVRRFGQVPDRLDTFFVVQDYRSGSPLLLSQARAALCVAKVLGGPWSVTAVFGVLPDAILNAAYNLVARHRYRLFGGSESCVRPSAEYQRRFVDR